MEISVHRPERFKTKITWVGQFSHLSAKPAKVHQMFFQALSSNKNYFHTYLSRTRNYGRVANLLPGITNVLEHFEKYIRIPQIKQLSDQVIELKKELADQSTKDFKEYFTGGGGFASLSAANVTDLCQTVSVLDAAVKNELSGWFVQQQLAEYFVLFDETQDIAWLDKIDQR